MLIIIEVSCQQTDVILKLVYVQIRISLYETIINNVEVQIFKYIEASAIIIPRKFDVTEKPYAGLLGIFKKVLYMLFCTSMHSNFNNSINTYIVILCLYGYIFDETTAIWY